MPERVSADSASGANANIARHLAPMAASQPRTPALKIPRGRTRRGEIDYLTLDFAELDAEVAAWSDKLLRAGITAGDRTLVMVRQGLPLIASVFGLFRIGAVPVVIDPGMGLKTFLACVARSRPRALVGIPLAQVISRVFQRSFSTVAVRVFAPGALTARLRAPADARSTFHASGMHNRATDLAAVLFTSGSTGAPKGVCYEHGMFDAQVRLIRETYGIERGEIDLPLLPLFSLFNPALGMTTIVPEIDPRRPAAFDPAKIVQAIQQEKVTNSFGSPTLWGKIGEHCCARGLTLPSLRRVLCAGAAVPASLWENSRAFLPRGRLHSPYGATEALPVATIASDEIESSSVRGACVGRAVPGVQMRIIAISDSAIAILSEAPELPPGEIGEIIVCGPVVTKCYDALPVATAAAKIYEQPASPAAAFDRGAGEPRVRVWHRMGDCGYRDDAGRVWFCGRKAERVQTAHGTLHTECCEQVFRRHPRIGRCALIGLGERGHQQPGMVVEARVNGSAAAQRFARELRALALQHEHTSRIEMFFFRERLPVDVRHNAKLHRLALAKWARTARAFTGESPA
jgi:acyl-CoA synthetase (AMP-forming)/AMP-acid ligase II